MSDRCPLPNGRGSLNSSCPLPYGRGSLNSSIVVNVNVAQFQGKCCQQLGTDRQAAFVDVEVGRVQGLRMFAPAFVRQSRGSQTKHAARDRLPKEGEVFGTHARQRDCNDGIISQQLPGRGHCCERHGFVIVQARRVAGDSQFYVAPVRRFNCLTQTLQGGEDRLPGLFMDGANGAGQFGMVRDDVVGDAALKRSDGENRRVSTIVDSWHQGVGLLNPTAGRGNGIDGLVGPGTVARTSLNHQLEHVATRRERPDPAGDFADRESWIDMNRDRRAETLQRSLFDHVRPPFARLLGGLPNSTHGNRNLQAAGITQFLQQSERAEGDGRVRVMAAGVHHGSVAARIFRCELRLNRQGIDVATDADSLGRGLIRMAIPIDDEAEVFVGASWFEAEFGELIEEVVGGFPFLHRQLGIVVQVSANGLQHRQQVGSMSANRFIQGHVSKGVVSPRRAAERRDYRTSTGTSVARANCLSPVRNVVAPPRIAVA